MLSDPKHTRGTRQNADKSLSGASDRPKTETGRQIEELSSRVAELEAIYEAQNDAILIYDLDSKVRRANPSFYATYGFDPVGLNLKEIAERLSSRWEDGRPFVWEEQPTPRALRGDRVTGAQYVVSGADGTELVVETSSGPMRAGERVVGSVTVLRDITQRKRAERELRENEERYRSLFDNMLNGFAYCKMLFDGGRPTDFIYQNVNAAFETLTGLKNVTGKKVSEVIPGIRESNPELFEIYGRVALTVVPEQFETYVEALGMWFAVSVYSPRKEYFVSVFDVITERKQAEEALKNARDNLERKAMERTEALRRQAELLELAHNAIIVRDLESKITFWNRGAEDVYGWTKSDALGRVTHTLLETEFPVPFDEHMATLTREGRWEGELVHTTKDGRRIIVLSRQALQRDRAGNPLAILEINLDITSRKEGEKNLEIKSRTLEELNTALKVLLRQREEDKSELEENIVSNIKNLVLPYVEKLKKSRLNAEQASSVEILETNLNEVTSPLMRRMQAFDLTPKEIEVASHLKDGRTTKQIAELLGVSPRVVEFHRYNIRKKLGLGQKKMNLRTYLLSMA